MVRSKIRYELIADERTRRETFKKRRTGLLKKLKELRTLCDVEACGVVTNGDGTQSEIWPSPNEASQIVQSFINLPPSHTNNRVDQIGFLRQNLSRISRNLDKESTKIQSLEKELILSECLTKEEVNVSNTNELLSLLEKKIEMIDRMISISEASCSKMVASAKETSSCKGKEPV